MGNLYETTVDEEGRITLSKEVRKAFCIVPGDKVKIETESDRIIIEKAISPDEFIASMIGFIKDDSAVPLSDPLNLKQIWK